MTTRPYIISVCANPDLASSLDLIASVGSYPVGRIDQYAENGNKIVLSKIPATAFVVAFVDMRRNLEAGINTIAKLGQLVDPHVWTVAISDRSDSNTVLQSLRAGSSEFLAWPASEDQIKGVLDNIARRARSTEKTAVRHGNILMFFGACGGAGTTTIATHAARALAADEEKEVLLIDMHRSLGGVAIQMGVKNSKRSFCEAMQTEDRLDGDLFRTMLTQHPSGVSILCSPDNCNDFSHLLEQMDNPRDPFQKRQVDAVVEIVRNEFDWTVIDADWRAPESIFIARRAEHVYFVCSPDIISMRNVARLVDLVGYEPSKQSLILSRAGSSIVPPSEVAKAARLGICAKIPEITDHVSHAVNAGVSVPSKAKPFHAGISAILERVTEEAEPVAAARRGIFGSSKRGRQ